MASPLEHFRKNQKTYMAVLVVVSLITFVLLPGTGSRDEIGSLFSGNSNKSLVSWKGGSLGQAELERMRKSQLLTYRVFEKLFEEVSKAGGTPKIPSFQQNANNFSLGIQPPPNADSMTIPQVYQAIANQHLLTETAAKHGIVVDDKAVDAFIQKFTDGKVSAKRFAEIIKETTGAELSRFDMYRFLRGEIARQILVSLGDAAVTAPASSVPLVTPAKNWSNFQKFQQRAKIEAYPVFVDKFLEKVTEKPLEQELRAIYERGKNQFLPAESPEPGFFRGYKTNLEYVVADMDSFIKKEEANITDELLKAEYDKRVNDQGAYRVPDEIPVAEPTGVETKKKDNDSLEKTDPAPGRDESAGDKKASTKLTEEAKATEPKKPAQTRSDEPKPTETKPDVPSTPKVELPEATVPTKPGEPPATTPGTPAPSTPAPSTPIPADAPKSSYLPIQRNEERIDQRGSIRLVAFQNEEKAAEVKAAVTEAVTESKPAATEPAAEVKTPAVEVKPEADVPTATVDAPKEKTAEATASETPKSEPKTEGDAKPAEKKEVPMRTRTFDEVRVELKREMAQGPARVKREEALKAVAEIMEKYFHENEMYRTRDPNDKTMAEPEAPKLAKLADDFGLNYGKTGMVDSFSVQSLSIGRSFLGDFRQSFPVQQAIFNPRVRLLFPLRSMGFDANQLVEYVFWKTEDESPRMPAFEECREEVEKAWKMSQARRLASEKAGEIATSLNATNDSNPWPAVLEEGDRDAVVRPPMFTWLQPPFRQGDLPSLATIDGISQPGANFMERVFSGKIGQSVVAFNEIQDICFVMKIVERSPSDEELQTKFQASPGTDDATRVLGQAQAQAMATGWLINTQNSIGVDASKLQSLE